MPRLLFAACLAALLAPAAVAQTCTHTWNGGNGHFNDDERWTPASAPRGGDVACITAPGTYTVQIGDARSFAESDEFGTPRTVGGIVLGGASGTQTLLAIAEAFNAAGRPDLRLGTVTIHPNGRFEIPSGSFYDGTAVANAGVLRFSTDGFTDLLDDVTIVNTGRVEVDRRGGFLYLRNDLVNEASGTLAFTGPSARITFDNQGRVVNRGRLTSSGGAGDDYNSIGGTEGADRSFVNENGRVEVTDGELRIGGGRGFRLVGGEYHAEAGARLLFTMTTNELEGTLTGAPAGTVEFDFGASGARATGAGATWAFGGTGARLTRGTIKGVWRNEGLLVVAGAGVTVGSPADPATFTNTGRTEIAAGELSVAGAGSALVNEADGVVAFTSPERRIFGFQNGQILNRGRIVAEAGPASVDSNTGGPGAAAGILNDGGRFEATGGSLTVNGSRTRLVGGIYAASAGNTFRLATTYVEADGVLTGEGDGTFRLRFQTSDEQVPGEEGVFAFGGTGLIVERGTFSGAWRNAGLVRVLPGDAVAFPATAAFVNTGTVEWAGGVDVIAGGVFTNEAGATLALAADLGITRGGGLFVNRGLIAKTGGTGATSFAPGVQNLAGGEIRAETGTLSFSALTDETGAVYSGTGTITPPSGFVVAGTLSPGVEGAPGTLTWGRALAVAPSFVLDLDVAGPDAGTGYDRLAVTGTATLGGTAVLRKGADYSPAVGTAFPGVLTATSVTGTFATEDLDQGFSLVVGPTTVDAVVTSPVGAEDGPAETDGPAAFAVATLSSPSARPSVRVTLPEAMALAVEVYDVQGRQVARLAEGERAAGVHALPVAGLAPGVYVARVVASGATVTERATQRLVVVR